VLQVTLYIDINKTLDIVSALRQHGWISGKDFDFACYKPKFDLFGGSNWESKMDRHTIFTFYNDSNASYFMLRWG
jgi:hypothetical protein